MVFPAAMNVYAGAELLKNMDPKWRELQRKEFSVIGVARAKEYGASGLSVGPVRTRAQKPYASGISSP